MVGTAQLTNAVMLNNVSQDIGKVVGPAVAGILIAAAGLPSTFLINAASFVTVIAGLLLMRPDELTTPKRKATGAREFRDGLAYVRTTPAAARATRTAGLSRLGGLQLPGDPPASRP